MWVESKDLKVLSIFGSEIYFFKYFINNFFKSENMDTCLKLNFYDPVQPPPPWDLSVCSLLPSTRGVVTTLTFLSLRRNLQWCDQVGWNWIRISVSGKLYNCVNETRCPNAVTTFQEWLREGKGGKKGE